MGDKSIPHEDATRKVVDEQMARTSNQGAIADAVAAAGANPTKAEYDALVVKVNSVLKVLRDAELIPTA